jgi:hypothetical protein
LLDEEEHGANHGRREMGYRDGDAVVREMLAGKRADALGRARSFGYARRAVIDERAIADLEALHDRTMAFLFDDVTSSDEAQAAIRKVDELIAAYDALLARSASLLQPRPLDVEASFVLPTGWRGTSDGATRLAREMTIDRAAVDRFEVRERAVGVAAGPWALVIGLDETGEESWVEGRMTVAIPQAIPPVRIRREENTDALMQDFGMKLEIETADARFDDLYWVEGHREAAFAAATPLVRRLMIDLSEQRCALEVRDGVGRFSWEGPWTALGSSGVPPNLVPAIMELRASFCE